MVGNDVGFCEICGKRSTNYMRSYSRDFKKHLCSECQSNLRKGGGE